MPPPPANGNRTIDMLDEVCDYVSSAMGMTMGKNFFNGELPEPGINGQTAPDGVYTVELPGPPPDMYIDTETHLVQFWSVSSDSRESKAVLRRIYDILERKGNYALVNWYVYFSYANATIKDEGRNAEGSKRFSLDVAFICRNLNNIS